MDGWREPSIWTRLGSPGDRCARQPFSITTVEQSIDRLPLFAVSKPAKPTVRGSVILTSPTVFVQDSSGGVSVPHPSAPPLKIGDEVEVSGEVHPRDFSSSLAHATVQVLWARNPVPSASVTA